jgi:hypothetical protein
VSGLATVRAASLEYATPIYEKMWRGLETVTVSGLATVRAVSLEFDERMWRSLQTRPSDGARHPPVFLVPGDRDLVPVKDAARFMGKTEAEVARLAELGFLHSRQEDGGLKVEPAIVGGKREAKATES